MRVPILSMNIRIAITIGNLGLPIQLCRKLYNHVHISLLKFNDNYKVFDMVEYRVINQS
jgi:hypothetical protein